MSWQGCMWPNGASLTDPSVSNLLIPKYIFLKTIFPNRILPEIHVGVCISLLSSHSSCGSNRHPNPLRELSMAHNDFSVNIDFSVFNIERSVTLLGSRPFNSPFLFHWLEFGNFLRKIFYHWLNFDTLILPYIFRTTQM